MRIRHTSIRVSIYTTKALFHVLWSVKDLPKMKIILLALGTVFCNTNINVQHGIARTQNVSFHNSTYLSSGSGTLASGNNSVYKALTQNRSSLVQLRAYKYSESTDSVDWMNAIQEYLSGNTNNITKWNSLSLSRAKIPPPFMVKYISSEK